MLKTVVNLRVRLLIQMTLYDIEGILPKGPYPPCSRMADRALLAGYPRNTHTPMDNVRVMLEYISTCVRTFVTLCVWLWFRSAWWCRDMDLLSALLALCRCRCGDEAGHIHNLNSLTHWGRDKMAVILHTIFSMHFLERRCMNFDYNFTGVCF